MAQAINWTLDVKIVGGPSASATSSLNVGAYDKVDAVIPGGPVATPGTASIDVQPGGAGKVKFLLISSDKYSDKLTYDVHGTGGAAGVKLDSQQLLIGEGAIGLLGIAPKTLDFSNKMGTGNDATISILVGRDAT
jgi:hypothetical protein